MREARIFVSTANVRFWPEADIPPRFMASTISQLDAFPERLAGLAINVRFGDRKLAQFNIIEHYKLAPLTHASPPGADCSECALAYPTKKSNAARSAGWYRGRKTGNC